MSKLKIELNELNKLYDEIYYGNFDNIETALEIISNIISEKEFEDEDDYISGMSNITDVIIEILDEVAETFDNEGLYDISSYIRDKIDRIQSGEIDDYIENTYINYLSDDYDEIFDEDEIFGDNEDYDEDDIYDDEY